MKLTWFGTASIQIESEKETLLFDPYLCYAGAENRQWLLDYININNILITHGHFDHLASIPKIMDLSEATVYTTKTPAETLEKKRVDPDYLAVVKPGAELSFGDMKVEVLQGRHVKYDKPLLKEILLSPKLLRHFYRLPYLLHGLLAYPEAEEIVAYLVKCEEKRVLVLGSLGLDEDTEYPENVDLLVLPYQGTSLLVSESLAIIERLKPKAIMLDHFDNAFPPITKSVDTKPLKKALTEKYPDIKVVKPTAGKPITL